jgi:HEPN domain-containing protein
MKDGAINDEVIGFHVQQAIEKLLKALLVHLNIDYSKRMSLNYWLKFWKPMACECLKKCRISSH